MSVYPTPTLTVTSTGVVQNDVRHRGYLFVTGVENATTISAILQLIPADFVHVVRDQLHRYWNNADKAAVARSSHERLKKHLGLGSFPTSFNAISAPVIQFPSEVGSIEQVQACSKKVADLIAEVKTGVLRTVIDAKKVEFLHYLQLTSIDEATTKMKEALAVRLEEVLAQLAFPPPSAASAEAPMAVDGDVDAPEAEPIVAGDVLTPSEEGMSSMSI
jgi:hypothetical protein